MRPFYEFWRIGRALTVLHAQMPEGFNAVDHVEKLANELNPIGERSNSYPYLALARRIDAEYGDVLWFADYLTTFSPTPRDDPRFSGALERLSHEQRSAIAARVSELQRGDAR